MVRFILFLAGVSTVTLGVLWYTGVLESSPVGVAPADSAKDQKPGDKSVVADRLDFGQTPDRSPALVHTRRGGRPPVVMFGLTASPRDTEEVSFRVDGKLTFVPLFEGIDIKEGDIVAPRQLLGVLDTRMIATEVLIKRIQSESKLALDLAEKKVEVTSSIVQSDKEAPGSVSKQQQKINILQDQQARIELKKAIEEQLVAKSEYEQKLTALGFHRVYSGIGGRVDRIYKKSNESVRAGETVYRIVNLDTLYLDGTFPAENVKALKKGDLVAVEPERLTGSEGELSGHTGTVNGLAITSDGRYMASCSDDRSVRFWDLNDEIELDQLKEMGKASEVYTIAADPTRKFAPGKGGSYAFVAGGADSWLRLWTIDVNAEGQVTGRKVWSPTKDAHRGAIRSVAFSPDGKWFATGGEDRHIIIWKVGEDTPQYWVKAETDPRVTAHRGTVTTLCFTPDGGLISAAADKTVRKWKLGEKNAELEWEEHGRTGDVAQLGVSPDGRRMFFEVDEELRILDTNKPVTLDVLRNRKHGSFTQLAAFSPSTKYVLTTTDSGRVQLWTMPTPAEFAEAKKAGVTLQRPHELRKLVAADNAAVKCAAFDPQEQTLYTAGTDKVIRFWKMPEDKERLEPLTATIVDIGENVASGTGLLRVRAEMKNPADRNLRLKPGDLVNLTLYPKTRD